MPSLTEQQEAVISHVAQHPLTVVGAGAGSGKTFTTIATVLDRLEKDVGGSLDQFVLITFTNEAADELRDRLERAVENRITSPIPGGRESSFWREQRERLASAYVGTIHGFCSRVLKTFGYEADVARETSITSSGYLRKQALRDAVEAHAVSEPPLLLDPRFKWEIYELERYAGQVLEQARGRGYNIGQLRDRTASQPEDRGKSWRLALIDVVADAERRYESVKRDQYRLDADDLIRRVADLLSGPQGTDIAGHLRGRYRYLFLDEFQDTDMVQRRIVDAFVGVFHAVLVVGDGKQSIYRFRSADPSLLYEIARDNGVDVLPLNLSRRPTLPLLDVQNALFRSIGGNPNYRELASPLEASEDAATPSDDIPPLTFIQHDRSTRGADVLATIIRDLVSGDFDDSRGGGLRRVEPGDIVVLLRYNWQVQDYLVNLSNTLQADGISVRVEEAGMFFRRPEIVATHRMLRLVLEYPDDTLLSMALRSPYLRSIDPSDEERRLLHYPPRFGHPLTDWFERTDPARRDLLSKLRQAALVDTVPQVIAQLYRDFGIREHYLARADRQAAANLDKLRELARRLFNEEQALTLRQFVNFLQLSIETGQEESDARVQTDHEDSPESRPPYIRLMTVHGAKGLEFPFVLLPDMHLALRNPRHLPTFLLSRTHGFDFALPRTADRPEDVEFTQSPRFQVARNLEMREQIREEMRILYVAVTRAQHAVYMTGANGGRRRNGPNSAFYSWQDEVLPTFPTLAPLGAVLRSG